MRITPVNTIGLKIQNNNKVRFGNSFGEGSLLSDNFKTYSSIYDPQSSKSAKMRLLDTINKFAEEIMYSAEKSDESVKIVTDFYKDLASNSEEEQVIRRDAFSMLGHIGIRLENNKRMEILSFMRDKTSTDKSLDEITKRTIENVISLLEGQNYIEKPISRRY